MSTAAEASPVPDGHPPDGPAPDGPAPDGYPPDSQLGVSAESSVAGLLAGCRVPARLAGPAVAALGRTAGQQLRADPWLLLVLPQVRPDQADWFARQLLGGAADPQDPRRGRALAGYLLGRAARDGHTAVPAEVIIAALRRLRIADPAAAVAAAVDAGTVLPSGPPAEFGDGPSDGIGTGDGTEDATGPAGGAPGDGAGPGDGPDGPLLALARYAMAEEAVAEGVQRLTALAAPLGPGPGAGRDAGPGAGPPLSVAQQAVVDAVAQHGVSVLAGGPGAGTGRAIAAAASLAREHGLRVALAAPTARAAQRLGQLTGVPAVPVHRLLAGPVPLDAGLVVLAGAAQLAAETAAALVEACADGTRLLLVGDPAGLPPDGPGQVLADLISSGAVPVTELTELHRPRAGQRAGGQIARLAAAVRAGTLPPVDSPDREVVVVGAPDSATASHRVIQLVTDSIPRALGIAGPDVQVITPVPDGPAGSTALNQALKQRLNPGPGRHGGFDPGDRVVLAAGHPVAGASPGEVGTVAGPAGDGLLVEFPDGPVAVPGPLPGALRPAWALTPRQAQGAGWPAVVAVFPAEAAGRLSRPLVYTTLTRAQCHLSVVHGAGPALAAAVAGNGARPRVTGLAALLASEAR